MQMRVEYVLVDTVRLNYGPIHRVCVFIECASLLNIPYKHDQINACLFMLCNCDSHGLV